jgi:hypothetical protein
LVTSLLPQKQEAKRLLGMTRDFAVGQLTQGGRQLTQGGRASLSQLDEFGAAQGWTRGQSAAGPLKYEDENEIT